MSQKASPTAIGAFVVGAVALVVVGLLVFGGGRFFTDRTRWVAYFDESVTGLTVGSPVTSVGSPRSGGALIRGGGSERRETSAIGDVSSRRLGAGAGVGRVTGTSASGASTSGASISGLST